MINKKFKYIYLLMIIITMLIIVNIVWFDKKVMAENKKVVLATDFWEPHYGPKLKNGGYITEIAKESFKRMGYNCECFFVPWKRAFELGKQGRYDGLLGAFYSKERSEFFEYSKAISEEQLVFFSKKNNIIRKYSSLHDLKGFIIGVVRGYHYTDEFNNASYLTKDVATKTSDNIRRLIKGRLDLILASKLVVIHTLKKSYPKNVNSLIMLEPPLVTNKLYVPISKQNKKYKQIVQDFNSGLKIIKEDGTFDKIKKKHGVNGVIKQRPDIRNKEN